MSKHEKLSVLFVIAALVFVICMGLFLVFDTNRNYKLKEREVTAIEKATDNGIIIKIGE